MHAEEPLRERLSEFHRKYDTVKITILIFGALLFAYPQQGPTLNQPSTSTNESNQQPQKQITHAPQSPKDQHRPSQPSTAIYNIEASPQSGQESNAIGRKEEMTTNR